MPRTYKVGPSGSLGARYGTISRRRYASIVENLRRPYECPRCSFISVRRLSIGIWSCGKCGLKFAGGAYTAFSKLGELASRAIRSEPPATFRTRKLEDEEAKTPPTEPVREKRVKARKRRAKVPTEEDVTSITKGDQEVKIDT